MSLSGKPSRNKGNFPEPLIGIIEGGFCSGSVAGQKSLRRFRTPAPVALVPGTLDDSGLSKPVS